jgi:flagellin-specific chaperone FliS
MSQKTYPGYKSLFLEALPLNKDKRMDTSTYRQVIDQVSYLYSKVSPRNCSQNTKAQYEDIDLARSFMRNKERAYNKLAKLELSKLNNPIKLTKISLATKKIGLFESPASTKRTRLCEQNDSNNNRLKGVENVIQECESFKPQIKPKKKELVSHEYFKTNTLHHAANIIGDLSECLKLTTDQERISNMMSTFHFNRETDETLRKELKTIKAEMLKTTNKLVSMSGYKLWKQNNVRLMSSTDKVIYSLPLIKK